MESVVFNNQISSGHEFAYPQLSKDEETQILSGLFEELLLFDKITLSTGRVNFTLYFLIDKLGVNLVEELIERGYIRFMLWAPLIVTSTGMMRDDKTIDEEVIYGQSPIVAGSLSPEDSDPQKNIYTALDRCFLHRDRKKSFAKKAENNYDVLEGLEYSLKSTEIVISAYENNNLMSLGLPFEKPANQLNVEERGKLQDLGYKVLETSILSKYGLKSYEDYEPYEICKSNLENIGKAFNISDNTSELFKLHHLPNLKQLYISERLDFRSVFKIRKLSTSKYYRKWINTVGESSDVYEVTADYMNSIMGKNRFFESNKAKLVKEMSLFALNAKLGSVLAGPIGTVAGGILGLLETFWLDGILKGKNPSMFIDEVKKEAYQASNEVYQEKVR